MSATIIPVLIVCLILWRMYGRVRRNIGRQPLRPRLIKRSIVLISIGCVFIVGTTWQHPPSLLGFGGGILPGVILALIGLKLTRFETTDEGHFYTPSTHIGVGLSLLFAGRLLYRFWVLRNISTAPNHPPPMQSPLTYFIVGLVIGYYIVYYIGLFVHTHDKKSGA
ncbi:MAG: DUF1453 domain-containing protein [Limisphaerales bacterium]